MDSCFVTATYRLLTSEPNKQFFSYSGDEKPFNISTKQNVKRKQSLQIKQNTPTPTKSRQAMYHCCSGKAISITHAECVFVTLNIQHS